RKAGALDYHWCGRDRRVRAHLPLGRTVIVAGHSSETELCVMILDEFVPIGRPEDADQFVYAAANGVVKDLAENHSLHFSSKDAAAHQPSIDIPGRRPLAADEDADHAVVAEDIGQSYLQCEAICIALHCGNLRLHVAPRRQIELVRFIDELNDA